MADTHPQVTPISPLIHRFLFKEPTTLRAQIGPEQARILLDASAGNRTIRKVAVEKYARDMKNGDWQQTGDPLQISKSGKLLNGHHRLEAVILSGIVLDFFVTGGLDDTVREVVDTGVARKVADDFKMAGFHPLPQMCGSVSLLALHVESGAVDKVSVFHAGLGAGRWSHTEVLHWGETHREVLEDSMDRFGRDARKPALKGMAPTAWIYALMRIRAFDDELADQFANSVLNRETNGKGDPRNALLDYLQARNSILARKGIPASRIRGMSASEGMYITFVSYMAWRKERLMGANALAPTQGVPIPYPRKSTRKVEAA